MNKWVNGLTNRQESEWKMYKRWIDRQTSGWVGGQISEWEDGMDGWIGGWIDR